MVSFNTNGHGDSVSSIFDTNVLPNPLPELSAEGWVFEGWYKDNNFTILAIAGTAIKRYCFICKMA